MGDVVLRLNMEEVFEPVITNTVTTGEDDPQGARMGFTLAPVFPDLCISVPIRTSYRQKGLGLYCPERILEDL